MPTLFETLRKDHDHHRNLLARLVETEGASEERKSLFQELRAELEAHAAAEERALYAHMMQHPSSTDAARHGVAEHQSIDKLIEELTERDLDDPHWLPAARKLKHEVEHHLEEEEHGIFQLAGKVLPEDDKTALAGTFVEAKEQELERRSA